MTKMTLPAPRPMPLARAQAIRQIVVDSAAAERFDRRPHGNQTPWRRRWVMVGAVAAATTVGATVGINILSTGNAYASWTAVPDQLQGAALTSAGNHCQAQLSQHFRSRANGLVPAVAEKRGRFSATLVAADSRIGICINGLPHGQLGGIIGATPASKSAITVDATPGLVNGPDAVREAIGHIYNPTITRIVVWTVDGRHITASVAHGLYVAWWPTGADVRVVTGYDDRGVTVATTR